MSARIVLAYSGGLRTADAIRWLKASRGAEVIAVTLDLGQGGDLEAVRDSALALGAARAHVLDLRDDFARDAVVPALRADALYDDRYPVAAALAWPIVARKLAEIADIEQTGSLAHGGATADGEVSPLTTTIRAWRPGLSVVTVPSSEGRGPIAHANLWGRSIAFGTADDAWHEPPEHFFTLTRSGADCPNEPAYVDLSFVQGVPQAINGVAMPLVDLIGSLTTIAGAHGVGRLDFVESRAAAPVRRVFEAPAAIVLHMAHKELTRLVAGRELDRFLRHVRLQYADLVCHGQWFSPFREALDGFVGKVQERVSGDVRLKLFKGACRVAGRKAPPEPPAPDTRVPPVAASA